MEKSGKSVMISVIGVASFTILFLFYFNVDPGDATSPDTTIDNLTLKIDYKNGTIDNFANFSLDEGQTSVFDAVNKNCDILYTIYPNGDYYISNINGVDIGWIYHVNIEFYQIPVNKYHLSDGDIIEFEHV